MPYTRLFWLATGLVTLAALLFAGYFIFYLTGRHDAYITSAEDLGIMDQAIWSTLHGQLFHQTICNTVNDTNCYGFNGISRFAILSMACKEEIPLTIIIFGLWSILFQQRWRSGLALVLLAIGWIGLEYFIIHIYSPVGHPLLISRYASLGSNPLAIAKTLLLHPYGVLRVYVFDPYHQLYLRILLSPAGYLPLLAPWVFVLAVPGLAVNLLSADPNMHSGFFQYNAEIVPVLIFSTIEAIVLILWVAQWSGGRLQAWRRKKTAS